MENADGSRGDAQVNQDVDGVDDVYVHVNGADGVLCMEVPGTCKEVVIVCMLRVFR